MTASWVINNIRESNGFVAKRILSCSILLVGQIFGSVYIKNNRILLPEWIYKEGREE